MKCAERSLRWASTWDQHTFAGANENGITPVHAVFHCNLDLYLLPRDGTVYRRGQIEFHRR